MADCHGVKSRLDDGRSAGSACWLAGGGRWGGARRVAGDECGATAARGVELGESLGELVERSADDGDVVARPQVGRERGGGRQLLEVLGENLAAAAAALAVVAFVEERPEAVVGA